MELKDFDFSLPDGLIAQYPAEKRAAARLMLLDRVTGAVAHKAFGDIKAFLRAGDVVVLNNTKVIHARLKGRKSTGGGAEILLVERLAGDEAAGTELWRTLVRPAKGLVPGKEVFFKGGVKARIIEAGEGGFRVCEFSGLGETSVDAIGEVPLPPYIRREPEPADALRYQTVYAEVPGAIAAPTAGLHFTAKLLEEITASGVEVRYITLHTGPATFLPVRDEDLKSRTLGGESYSISDVDFNALCEAKRRGRRVVAVGTTTTRALESAVNKGFNEPVLTGTTGLFIYPGFEFKVVDALVTNFHLPASTLIMLASAFAGTGNLRSAYMEAIKKGYRFYSYGDAMFIS